MSEGMDIVPAHDRLFGCTRRHFPGYFDVAVSGLAFTCPGGWHAPIALLVVLLSFGLCWENERVFRYIWIR